ncbi:MAG: head-tail adaptor [Malazfec virus 1]
MIELVKKLINFEVEDLVIEFYLTNSINAIKNYINDDTVDVEQVYNNEVVELAVFFINKSRMLESMYSNGNVKSVSSAGRSVTFMTMEELCDSIPDYIKARLKRKVKVKVW